MYRGPRKGVMPKTAASEPRANDVIEPLHHQIEGFNSERVFKEVEKYQDVPLLHRNRSQIRKNFFKGKQGTSLNTVFGRVAFLAAALRAYQKEFGVSLSSTEDFDHTVPLYFMRYCSQFADPQRRYKDFERLAGCIGIPPNVVPENPFMSKKAAVRSAPTEEQSRKAINIAKADAWEVIKRYNLVQELKDRGHDPRREYGGKFGDWQKLENRMFMCRKLVKQGVLANEDLKTPEGWAIVGGLRDKLGAVAIDPKLGPVHAVGLLAHLQFFYPSPHDLLPFVFILMMRGMLNFGAVAETKVTDEWFEPYPYVLEPNGDDRLVMIVLNKHRGVPAPAKITAGVAEKLATGIPKLIRFPSDVRPWSHPFRVIEFLIKLTQPLRDEINRRIRVHRSNEGRTKDDDAELEHLSSIKDDLLIYRSKLGIGSYRNLVRTTNGNTLGVTDTLKRYGLSGQLRELRDAGLTFSFKSSTWNLSILQMLARHGDRDTANIYARRRQSIEAARSAMKHVSAQAMVLARSENFSVARLRKVLTDQGLNPQKVANVLDKANRTRFGNACIDPKNPPPGFDRRTRPAEFCHLQNCIDGCPHARFLPESLPHLIRERLRVQQQLDYAGAVAGATSILFARLSNLNDLLARFPSRVVARLQAKIAKEMQSSHEGADMNA